MMKKLFLVPMLLGVVGAFLACSPTETAGGPGSETTNGLALVDGSPASFARVALRKAGHMAESAEVENSIVVADTVADSAGRFFFEVRDSGDYRLTVLHEGLAYTKIVTAADNFSEDAEKLQVNLVPTAVLKGEVDIPEGSSAVWVGIFGTDILIQSDGNGVFVIPSVPANDSLKLYIASGDYETVLDTEDLYLEPSEFAYRSYRSKANSSADSTDSSDTVKKIVLLQSDGTPAANAQVALRMANAISGTLALQNNLVLPDVVTDKDGKFSVTIPDSGSYRLTATLGSESFSLVYDASNLSAIDTLKLVATSAVSSKVTLDGGEEFAWVGVYGMDILVKTDELGAYVLPALPENDSLDLYFIHNSETEPFVEWTVKTSDEGTTVLNPVKLLYDFETVDSNWYMDVDTLWKGSTFKFGTGASDNDGEHNLADHLEQDKERGGQVFHTYYELAKDPYAWVLMGTNFQEIRGDDTIHVKNMASLDSIVFYAKGSGKIRVAMENWVSYTKNAKAASAWIALDSTWSRISVKPSELCVNGTEKTDCANTWNNVGQEVRQLHFFASGGSEFYIDDVMLYGALF